MRQLEEEEREYDKVNEEEEELQVLANSGHVKAQGDIIEWKEEIATLKKQAETSLTIMQHMAGMVHVPEIFYLSVIDLISGDGKYF